MVAGKLAEAAMVVMAASILSKIVGFARETALAAQFGVSSATDAYLVASVIPLVLVSVVTSALGTALIPVIVQRLEIDGLRPAFRTFSSIANLALASSVVLTATGIAAASLLVRMFAPGFSGGVFNLATELTRWLMPTIILQTASALLTALLQARGRFTLPSLVGIPFNIIIIASTLVLGPLYGIAGVAVGTVVAAAAQVLVQLPGVARTPYHYTFTWDLQDPGLRQAARLFVPVILANGVGQIGLIVDRVLASGLSPGSISALSFATRLSQLPLGVFVAGITTVLYPSLARQAVNVDKTALRSAVLRGINAIHFMVVPVAAGLVVLRIPVVRVLFERGAFDASATEATASALAAFCLGLVALALMELLSRTFFALQDSKTPMLVGLASVGATITFNLILVRPLGHIGLALGTSFGQILGASAFFWLLRKRLGGLGGWQIAKSFAKTTVAVGVMSGTVAVVKHVAEGVWPGDRLTIEVARLGISIMSGVVVYGAAAYFLGVRELATLGNTGRDIARKVLSKALPRSAGAEP